MNTDFEWKQQACDGDATQMIIQRCEHANGTMSQELYCNLRYLGEIELPDERRHEYEAEFDEHDEDGNGVISQSELEKVMQNDTTMSEEQKQAEKPKPRRD